MKWLMGVYTKRGKESLSVFIVSNDVLTLVPAIHHMIDRAWVLMAKLAWHVHRLHEVDEGSQSTV